VQFYGVLSNVLEEAVELFATRQEAEAIVQAWDRARRATDASERALLQPTRNGAIE
jgi:hypothetical protein